MATSNYPNEFDEFFDPQKTDKASVNHAELHQHENSAIEAIQATLGINPQGTYDSIRERLAAINEAIGQGLAGGGGGGINSVNGDFGPSVVLDADDIDDTTTSHKFATLAQLTQIATNTSNIATNTSNIATNTSDIATNTSNIATNTSDINELQDSSFHATGTFTGVTSVSIPVPSGFTRYRLKVTGHVTLSQEEGPVTSTTLYMRLNGETNSTMIGTLVQTPSNTDNRIILDWTGFTTVRVAEWGQVNANTVDVTFSTPFNSNSTIWNVEGTGSRISSASLTAMNRQHVQGRVTRASSGLITSITFSRIAQLGGSLDVMTNCRWWLYCDG